MTMQEALHALEEVKQAINLAYSSGYSAGKQQRQWVGLEIEEVQDSYNSDYQAQTRAVEKLLKERNA
jgi:hypothetical protein